MPITTETWALCSSQGYSGDLVMHLGVQGSFAFETHKDHRCDPSFFTKIKQNSRCNLPYLIPFITNKFFKKLVC